jgi:hypothetical protein
MSALGNLVGDIGAAAGQRGSTSMKTYTKNPKIQSSLGDLIDTYNTNVKSDSGDLSAFIQNYLKQTPQATAYTGEETGAIGKFYNGDVARQLAEYRAQRSQLGDLAVQQALAQNRGNMNRSVLGGGGAGDSSWNNRYGIGVASQLDLQNNLANLDLARGDYNTVLQGQIGMVGRRQALEDALLQRQLTPMQMRQSLLGTDVSQLGSLANVNNLNTQYAYQYNPSGWETAGNFVGDLAQTGMQAAPFFMGAPSTAAAPNAAAATMSNMFNTSFSAPGGGGGLTGVGAAAGPYGFIANNLAQNYNPFALGF